MSKASIGSHFLFLGFFFTPFTSLRFGFIGPGEIFILLAGLLTAATESATIRLDAKLRIFYRAWVGFLFVSFIGMTFNVILLQSSSGSPGTPIFDFLSYIFVLISVIITGHHTSKNNEFAIRFFRRLFSFWALTYSGLYGLSFFTPSIFGQPLRYYSFFSPLVENVHQAASVTCAMGFVMVYLGMKAAPVYIKAVYFGAAALFAKMALDSGSTKAMLGVWVGVVVGILVLTIYRAEGKGRFVNTMIFLIIGVLSAFLLSRYLNELSNLAVRFFSESDDGGARQALYSIGFQHGMKSFLVGYGPGSHAPYESGFSDAHNTLLTVFLQSGVLGVLIFLWFVVQVFRGLSVNFALVGAASALGMYILGGDVLRRLPIWIILMGIWFFATYQPRAARRS